MPLKKGEVQYLRNVAWAASAVMDYYSDNSDMFDSMRHSALLMALGGHSKEEIFAYFRELEERDDDSRWRDLEECYGQDES